MTLGAFIVVAQRPARTVVRRYVWFVARHVVGTIDAVALLLMYVLVLALLRLAL